MPFFSVIDRFGVVPTNVSAKGFLIEDRWDDWGKYQTQFRLVVFGVDGQRYEPGDVKIGELGLKPSNQVKPGMRAPTLPREFDYLSDRHFSLGQVENYYETLNEMPTELRDYVLSALRDCARFPELFASVVTEEVMSESLLRHVRAENVRTRLHRLSLGDASHTHFHFEYVSPSQQEAVQPLLMAFDVVPASSPPTNVHVLIGRNGVGKTRCLQGMARALLATNATEPSLGAFRMLPQPDDIFGMHVDWSFAGVVFVSFSAFDPVELSNTAAAGIRSVAIGLQQSVESNGIRTTTTKTRRELAKDFVDSLRQCRSGILAQRWEAALKTLENDPLFAEADVRSLLRSTDQGWELQAERLFLALSSGHAIVLLTITRLVEFVDEKTLVLMDEPECHLHPPLLSAFIRTLADLLIKRNGVAIVSTHSPVVLQEVPKSCVWVLRRSGAVAVAERPTIETFGENVGSLTREVFGLEVTNAGFHKLVRDAIEIEGLGYEQVLQRFGAQLGAEARSIASALVADRTRQPV